MTTHVTTKSLIDHRERARVLSEWERALWWMGVCCLAVAIALIVLGMAGRGYLVALLYWPIAGARIACGRAVDRNVELVRRDICEGGES